jgi:TPR repeat protein
MALLTRFKIKRLKKKLERLYAARVETGKGQLDEEIATYFTLANVYKKKKRLDPEKIYQLECYRAAAHLGDANAQYLCAKALLEKARFWDGWTKTIFGQKIHQKYADNLFSEALSYLIESEEQGHPLAKRLHGLSYIRGWGVEKNDDQGFKLIIASIEQEGAWDRATKIFEDLGLNTPEFFSKLVSHQTHHQ